jgi:hypothetical protein
MREVIEMMIERGTVNGTKLTEVEIDALRWSLREIDFLCADLDKAINIAQRSITATRNVLGAAAGEAD